MGLIIGNTPGVLGALAGSSRVRPVALHEPGERLRPRLPRDQDDSPFRALGRNHEKAPRIGIGSGTASGPNNALKAISNTVEGVNRTRPSLEELTLRNQERAAQARARFKAQIEERREASKSARPELVSPPRNDAQNSFASEGSKRVESRLPEPSVHAQDFVSSLNEVSARDVVRVEESEPPVQSGGPSFQINGQSIAFGNSNSDRFRLNVTA